jgi:Mg2+ and Co2+ transporter CorA
MVSMVEMSALREVLLRSSCSSESEGSSSLSASEAFAMSEERTARHLLVTFRTTPEDIAAANVLVEVIGRSREESWPLRDQLALDRCWKLLDEMLTAGTSPMIEDAEKVIAGMSKRLREKEDEIMDLLSEVGLLRDRGKEASRKLHELARKLGSVGTGVMGVKGLCETAWMLGEVAALLDKGT